jgi:hypothetical protein
LPPAGLAHALFNPSAAPLRQLGDVGGDAPRENEKVLAATMIYGALISIMLT